MTEETFDTLAEAISYAFRKEQTSMLGLERICQVLANPTLYIKTKTSGIVPCSTITRRRISSTLSSSDLFVRAGPPRTCLWAIRPHNPLFLSDGQISASIESMLTTNGPMTVQQFVAATELSGADESLFERFLADHCAEFSMDENDFSFWFNGQPRPQPTNFENISSALIFAFKNFPNGASVEELHWFLCLSTVGNVKSISRRSVSRELSRRPDIFLHLSRAKYTLFNSTVQKSAHQIAFPMLSSLSPPIPQVLDVQLQPPVSVIQNLPNSPPHFDFFSMADAGPDPKPMDDDIFNPESFFTTDFQFSFD